MDSTTQTSTSVIKSLLYWRKNKLNGLACVPVIISIDNNGIFSMKTADNQVQFSSPASQAKVKFTGWGTMAVMIDNKKFDIVASGAAVSPDPTKEQLDEVHLAQGADATIDSTLNKVGAAGAAISSTSALGAGAGVAGSAAMQFAYYKGITGMKAWQAALQDAGASIQKSSMRFMQYFTLTVIGLIILFFIIGTVNGR